jgi:glycerophosphoryl diester phosphodiesterase
MSRVQETKDGHLVVLHDLQSVLRASAAHDINAAPLAALRAATPELDTAQVKV